MKTVILVSCVKKKLKTPAMAKDLYTSVLFQKSYQYAQLLNPDAICILSAKYGVLAPETIIEPYEMTLKKMKVDKRKEWSQIVLEKLRTVADLKKDKFILLCGYEYRKYLLPYISNYEIPMKGLRIGPQLHWLKEKVKNEHM